MSILKTIIRSAVRKTGHQIQKYPTVAFSPVCAFDLAVQLLMHLRGPEVAFIQVGANDGRYRDPLYKYVVKYPWRGILLEPQPDVFRRLQSNYAFAADRLIFENAAISPNGASVTMYRASAAERSDDEYASSVVSTNARVIARQLRVSQRHLEPFTVPSTTLDEVVERHKIAKLDVLQIDTEGHDYAVLSTLNLRRVRPTVIQFEHGHLAPKQIDSAIKYLNESHYLVLYGGHQGDTIAVDNNFMSQLP